MGTDRPVRRLVPLAGGLPLAPTLGGVLVDRLGGRYSAQLGIDVDAGDAEVERWFVASTLFGARIAATVAQRTFATLEEAGVHRITDVARHGASDLVALLDAGGYARYDARTSARLRALAGQVSARYGGEVAEIGRRFTEPGRLLAALDALPGWGPVTVALFLRELRGVWPGVPLGVDPRAVEAGRHLGLLADDDAAAQLTLVAQLSERDPRDLEAALVRLALAHRADLRCDGGRTCVVLDRHRTPPPVRHLALPGGRILTIRPMCAEDGPRLVSLYAALSEDDLYFRFFASRPPPVPFVMAMAASAPREGVGLVATVQSLAASTPGADGSADAGRIVAEATCVPLGNGDADLGITVAQDARGWLGPYLLDLVLGDAAARGIPNVQADVLMANAPMLAMLHRRGYALVGVERQPALVRLAVSTVGTVPSWPATHVMPRVLVETPGGRWRADEALRLAGFHVMGCPGPPGGWGGCPARGGVPCPLAVGADVIVEAVPGETGRALVSAHRRVHPSVPLCAELGPDDPDPGPLAARLARDAPEAVVVGILGQIVPTPRRFRVDAPLAQGAP